MSKVYLLHSELIAPSAGLYLRMVSAACRLRWALLLARIPLHHAWMAIAARYIKDIINNYMSTYNEIVAAVKHTLK